MQLKGYFKVARAIFPPLFTPKFFSHQAFSNTAALAIAQLPPPCTDASMSVFRHTPLSQTQQPHRQPSPLKRVEFASKFQEKIHAANAAEHRENFAARKIQPRPAVSPDMTECGTAQKMHIFQTSKRRQPRRRTRRHALRSSNTDAFKMPLKRLADAFSSILANLRPCTGVRDKDGRAYAPIRINIIYMLSNVRLVTIFLRKSAENMRFDAPRHSFCLFFRKTG